MLALELELDVAQFGAAVTQFVFTSLVSETSYYVSEARENAKGGGGSCHSEHETKMDRQRNTLIILRRRK